MPGPGLTTDADVVLHRQQLQHFLTAADPLQRELALASATDHGKHLVAQGAALDDLLALHQQAQSALAAPAGAAVAPDAALQLRLARGDALPMMLALVLPHQLDEQARTAQYQEGLRQADKLRAVGTLAAGIAHDFNNLLGSVIGLAELCALDVPPASPLARNLGGILQASRRAADLTAQLLNFAREQPLQLRPVLLARLLRDHQALWTALLPKGVPLRLSLPGTDLTVLADPAQIEQVLLNLVKNAGDALRGMAAPQVQLVLDAAVPAGGLAPWARLRVVDNGCGMAADTLARIFEPFFTTKEVNDGTGLGLASAHGIVSRHGGQLQASSTPGQGSCFTLWLPLAGAVGPSVAGAALA